MIAKAVLRRQRVRVAAVLITAVAAFSACTGGDDPTATGAVPQSPTVAATPSQTGATPTSAATSFPATTTPSTPPTQTAPPEVADEEVTVLVGGWGNGLFDSGRATGEGLKYLRLVHGWLVGGAGGGEMVPGIASDWEVSPDGLTWTFTIRDGVQAHNGEEIDVNDVFFTWDRHYRESSVSQIEGISGTYIDRAATSEDPVMIAPNQVQLSTTSAAQIAFPFDHSENANAALGAVLPSDYFQSVSLDEYESNPVGAGPFRLVSHVADQRMVMERFEGYFYQPANGFPEDRRSRFERLVLENVPEPATRAAAMRAGTADIVEANPLMIDDIRDSGGRVVFQEESVFVFVNYIDNWKPETWFHGNKEVRQALEYAIDKEAIVEHLYGNEFATVKGFRWFTPSALGYVPGATDPYPYDLEEARRLLAEAGYPDGEGIPPFRIHTWEAGEAPFMPELAQILCSAWRNDLNLDCQVVVGDSTSIRNQNAEGHNAGDLMLRSNGGRWATGRGTEFTMCTSENLTSREADGYLSPAPEDQEMCVLIDEKIRGAQTLTELTEGLKDVSTFIRPLNHSWSPFYLNTPWGVGPRIADWEPWPLVAGNTAMWTIELQ